MNEPAADMAIDEVAVTDEQFARVGDLDLCWQGFGDPENPAVVLIMGLGTQMIAWPVSLCEAIASSGYHVIRFDNRDIGLSSKCQSPRGKRRTSMQEGFVRSLLGLPVTSAYTLDDMAADTVGLMDTLGIDQAHIVGASMGGMIGQLVAADYPDRVLSLTSIMSATGSRWVPPGKPAVMQRLGTAPPSNERDSLIAHYYQTMRMIGSPGYPTPSDELRRRVAAGLDRSYYPAGTARQMMAIFASGSRVEKLKRIKAPTLVIHGDADPLVPLAGGRHTAKCIPGAELEVIEGMGHDFPPQLVPRIAGLLVGHLTG